MKASQNPDWIEGKSGPYGPTKHKTNRANAQVGVNKMFRRPPSIMPMGTLNTSSSGKATIASSHLIPLVE